jgi:hypothetical protein
MEEGVVTHPDAGTPQGGVVSPLLAGRGGSRDVGVAVRTE